MRTAQVHRSPCSREACLLRMAVAGLQSGGFALCDDLTQSNGPVKVEYFVKHEISQT